MKNEKSLSNRKESLSSMEVTIWTKLIGFKSPYRWMFTKHLWNILNIQWHPVDDHPAITTTLTRSSLCQSITFCFTNVTSTRPRPHSSCYKTANRAPRNTTNIFYRYPYAEKVVTRPVPSPRGALVGLSPPKNSPNPPKLKHKTL